jgi:protein-S-isoprenylcysteine O-methyltransferase Ste14
MELFPALRIGWLNGWIPFGLLVLAEGALFLSFPRGVVARLFDRSGWSQKQVRWFSAGKLFSLIYIVLIILTPLKAGSLLFVIGMALNLLGLIGLGSAMFAFRSTPLDQPVTSGLYKISRHPQIFMTFVSLLGACLAVGSWPALLMLVLSRGLQHLGILAEEEACLRQYGDSYRAYMDGVPRYFLFF